MKGNFRPVFPNLYRMSYLSCNTSIPTVFIKILKFRKSVLDIRSKNRSKRHVSVNLMRNYRQISTKKSCNNLMARYKNHTGP